MPIPARAVIHCPRCRSRFEPPGRITDAKAFNAFADAAGLMVCPRCHSHVILDENTMGFASMETAELEALAILESSPSAPSPA